MASSVSYELLEAKQGAINGIATLDGTGKLLSAQLPIEAVQVYKGKYATSAALATAHVAGLLADYAYVTETTSFWYWNEALETPAWVNQKINEADYADLTDTEKSVVPYIIV